MERKKICFVAQFPPPMHGLSKAVDTLYHSELSSEFDFEKINITDNKLFLHNLIAISKSNADLFYFTISQTKGGNIRDLIILKLIEKKGEKCLVHLHGGYYRTLIDQLGYWQRRVNYKLISRIYGAIVLGPSLMWIFQGMVPDEKIYIVQNCIDDEFLLNDNKFDLKIVGINKRRIKHILYLSNFIRDKGYEDVLLMAKLEKERVMSGGEHRFHFEFAGKFYDDLERTWFENYIDKNCLREYVTYHGIVGGEEKNKLLEKCDIFVLLTKYKNEGQPISILEAMGNGMTIVTTMHAGIPDLVENNVNGIVVSKDDINVDEIYNRILLLKDEDLIQTAIRNRRFIKNEYSQSKYICNMKKIFAECLY